MELLKLLPHRYPFLLVDRILEADEKHFKVLKNVTFNEPHFLGHFPDHPIMPGVLLVEAMAQAAVASIQHHPAFKPGMIPYLAGVHEARFLKPVTPGDTLIIEGELLYFRRGLARARVETKVEGTVVAKAEISFAVQGDA